MTLFDGRIETMCGDITSIDCNAVVNAANSSLLGGGGVDGAIHKAAGPGLLEECRRIRKEQYPDGLPAGQAVITDAGGMNCSRIIHTVGPVWKGGGYNEEETLASCYSNSLNLAEKEKLRTVAFPAISTGVYGYPPEKAAHVVYRTMKQFLPALSFPEKVLLVFFSQNGETQFLNALKGEPGIQN
ncbi:MULTISPECIES: O-acetyl-ADP-ribose deacetylase [unclassified Oceanispirochaeta]|uniref:O-acetyl-ADP-ribose deacetylase n=1 Tax=unclassified Oceanispirochaeta TaxID=2635722 RepID=UPI000E09C0C6|nr:MULTISPECIES: O-acetyl-ADP-ribose deacetylase [unclassified Oceanispirochaeta]MBF9018445.1 O-acetyl-ADP-ribose deacetylase [Oceanispirochaeta sp. M2]NPD73897.1 O-acetyl-ADP-ribose deacetylase [Oceanispirochaeta sp. M1]RDG30356.1 O-acetyl-ADP-ribose deacetylase [Oceanispirochaeta sp. M1]